MPVVKTTNHAWVISTAPNPRPQHTVLPRLSTLGAPPIPRQSSDMAANPTPSRLLSLLIAVAIAIAIAIDATASSPPPRWAPPRFPGKFSRAPKQDPARHRQDNAVRYETRFFEQRLDHFSFPESPKHFRQRYLVSAEHWAGPARLGPIFVYCGNEGDIAWFARNTGFVWEIAPRFGAMVLFPEHRYYGESMPYGSAEEAYRNATTLAYLTAEQALADFAVLISALKRNLSAEACPVVLFGGSYGGMLASWMRLKYPHIAIGALASSAPILQFEDIVPLDTYYDIASNGFKRESASCFKTIKDSWDVLLLEGQKKDGLLQLTETFHLCRTLKSTDDLSDWLESAYSYLAMVNYPYPAEFLKPLPAHPIREVCKRIDGCPAGTSILERIFAGISVFYNYTGEVECFEVDVGPDNLGENGWNWQACTEMVMPMSSSQESSIFPTFDFNLSSFEEQCLKDFGVRPSPRWITTEFGGHNIKADLENFGSNIIFSNGLLDPWSGGGVLQNISESIVALVTEEGAHHIDLRASTKEDPEWLVEQRATEIKLIRGWINDYYQRKEGASEL